MTKHWYRAIFGPKQSSGGEAAAVVLADAGTVVFCAVSVFLLRFEFVIPRSQVIFLYWGLLVWVPIKLIVFRLLNLNRGRWRSVSTTDIGRLFAGNLTASVLGGILIAIFGPPGFPRSLYILDFIFCSLATASGRLFVKLLFYDLGQGGGMEQGTRIFIYGSGTAGVTLLREIRASSRLNYAVCGFIDDDANNQGMLIHGIRVIGTGEDLSRLVPAHRVSEILIAVPSATPAQMIGIISNCRIAGVKCRTIPALADVVAGTALARQIRDVAVEDLLGRVPARLEHEKISAKIAGETVLVTGAAGSIGSELCRQIARFKPGCLVGFESAETPLFHLGQEMAKSFPGIRFAGEIGSIQNTQRLDEVLSLYRPSIVYHAAAYKHVALMESNIFEAVENNIFGTLKVAKAAAAHGVADFVMISSDKAVRPTSVMGVTKRGAELVVLGLQQSATKFVSVRFGNVLGSSGSVIPIFKAQIAAGGPVTVTHPGMERYFMTIPEASQLVLQASTMGRGGEIFVLDMGKPAKIVDLARNLIQLSGFKPDEEIRIEFTGIRPGEKLCEEINLIGENVIATHHEKIMIFSGTSLPEDGINALLEELSGAYRRRDSNTLVRVLRELVPEYTPSENVLQLSQ